MVNIIPPLVSMKSGQGKRECLLVESRALVACRTRFKLPASLALYLNTNKIPMKTDLEA